MSRHVIAYEGKRAIDGFFVQPGALYTKRDRVPVTVGFDFGVNESVIGVARDLERNEETGEVSMEVEFDPMHAGMAAGMVATIAISDVEGTREDVRKGAVMQVAFVMHRLWD